MSSTDGINGASGSPSITATAAATATPAAAKPARKKKLTLEDVAKQGRAPSAGGKVPAQAKAAEAGATVRAQGKPLDLNAFKDRLRSTVTDGQSLAQYREERQDAFDKRKEEVRASFVTMQTAIESGEELRKTVADNLEEIVGLMPEEMLAGTNFGKAKAEKDKAEGLFTKLNKWWSTKKVDKKPMSEAELADLLHRQIEISEAAVNTLEERTKGLEGVEQHLNASRIEFANLNAKAVEDFNDTAEVLTEVNGEIERITAEMNAIDDPMKREYGELEIQLKEKKDQARELTQLAAFLNDAITNYRDFEVKGEQLARMLTNVKSDADRILSTAFALIETQSVTTGVIAQIIQVINAADWTMLIFDTVQQNLARSVEWAAGRVGDFNKNIEEWTARQHDGNVQMTAAMLTANIKNETDLENYQQKIVDEYKAGKRAVAIPTSAKLMTPTTQNPLRAKSSALSQYITDQKNRMATRGGITFKNK